MSSEDPTKKGQDFLQIVTKAKEFTEELLKENERLRFKIAAAGASPPADPGSDERVKELQRRERGPYEGVVVGEGRHPKVEDEQKEVADRPIDVQEEKNNLAHPYVASYPPPSTPDYKERN